MKSHFLHDRACQFAGGTSFLLACALAVGCGAGKGTVTGRVLYNGKPVPGGWVIFRPLDSKLNTVNAPLDEKGNYEVVLSAGEVKIAVDNRELQPIERTPVRSPVIPPGIKLPPGAKLPEAEPADPGKQTTRTPVSGRYVAIPEKYHDVDTSGLTYSVQSGPQTRDIELK